MRHQHLRYGFIVALCSTIRKILTRERERPKQISWAHFNAISSLQFIKYVYTIFIHCFGFDGRVPLFVHRIKSGNYVLCSEKETYEKRTCSLTSFNITNDN